MKKLCFIGLLFFIPHLIWGVTIEYTNLTSKFIPTEKSAKIKSYYQLTSNFHIEKYIKKNTKLLLLNLKKYMLKNNYYLKGKLSTEHSSLRYEKAYILGGKVYLFEVKGHINNRQIKAKELVYDGYKNYSLKKCEVRTKFKIYRRRQLLIQEF